MLTLEGHRFASFLEFRFLERREESSDSAENVLALQESHVTDSELFPRLTHCRHSSKMLSSGFVTYTRGSFIAGRQVGGDRQRTCQSKASRIQLTQVFSDNSYNNCYSGIERQFSSAPRGDSYSTELGFLLIRCTYKPFQTVADPGFLVWSGGHILGKIGNYF